MVRINQEEYEKLKEAKADGYEWMARDWEEDYGYHGGDLFAYPEKPLKDNVGGWYCSMKFRDIDNHLFQFIQWEDSEPYNIAELIREFEWAELNEKYPPVKESEETEMKKDLKEAILGIEVTQFDGYKADLEEFVNPKQLEEIINDWVPKVLSQEEIGVPEWFAEWFEGRGYEMSLYGIFNDLYTNSKSKMEEWSKQYEMGHAELQNDIASIKLHGKGVYEVEEEQKFYVDLNTAAYVAKWNGDGSVRIYTDSVSGSDEYELLLTEQEIKGYDERFWPFAKPIEEVEKNGEN